MYRMFLPCLLLVLARAGSVHAQSAAVMPDARLYAAYDSAYIDLLVREHPALIDRWNYYLDHAFIITEYPAGKGIEQLEALPVVVLDEAQPVNILVLEKTQRLRHAWEKPVAYRINATNRVLMYHPGKNFNRELRQWREKR